MKSFKQWLLESKWSGYVYHATYKDFDPKDIKPGTHFGSLQSAMARAKQEYMEGSKGQENTKDKLKVHAFKYNGNNKRKMVKDMDMTLAGKRDWPNTREGFKKEFGTEHVSYKNRFEDPGSTSHVIWDTENLKHVHSFSSPKFVKRKYASDMIGWGTDQKNYEYLKKKGRLSGMQKVKHTLGIN